MRRELRDERAPRKTRQNQDIHVRMYCYSTLYTVQLQRRYNYKLYTTLKSHADNTVHRSVTVKESNNNKLKRVTTPP